MARAESGPGAWALRAFRDFLSQLGDAGRAPWADRQRRLFRGSRPVSPIRVARLSLGTSHADHARAEGTGADNPDVGDPLADGGARLDVLGRRRRDPRS